MYVTLIDGQVQCVPSVPRRQTSVCSVADEDLDEFEVSAEAGLMERRLTVNVELIDVDRQVAIREDATKTRNVSTEDGVQEQLLRI